MEKQSSLDAFIDIHICGACKSQFNNVEVFLLHKSQCPSLAELRAKMAAKMSSASSLEANGNNETPRTTEGEVASIKHLVQAAESQLVSSQQISSGESEVDSRHSTAITVQSGSGQSMVLTKDGILQAQEDSTSGWSQQVDQNTPTSSVMFLSSEEAAVFQKTKEASLDEKNKTSRSQDNQDFKQLQPAQTIYVEAIQQPDQDYELNRVKTKEEQFSGVSLSLNSGGSPRQGERTEVIVTETMLTGSGQQGMAAESGSLLPSAELVNQGEHYLVSEEGEASEVQSVMYSEETPLPPLRPFTSIRGQELMLAIDDPVSPSRKKYKCTFAACNFITLYVRDLERHVRTHTGERPFQCMHCSKAFSRSDKLKIHLRGHTGSKPFKCHYCDYGAADSSSLRKHLRIHTDERPFKCQICPYASRNSSQLIVHLRTHTGDTPFQCSLCDAKFKINSDLKRHMRTHTGEKPYGCELCDYRCSIRGNLKSHIRINHSNENEVKCNYCDFQTSSRKLLREHKKIHDTTHPVKCPTCNYCCANNSALKAHMRIHSDERPFNCNFCSYSSKQSGNVKTHVRKKHPEKLLGDRKPGRTIMKKGARAVATNTPSPTKTREERGYGSNLKPNCKKTFSCNICTAAFVREDSLRSHMRQHCKEIAQNLESTALAVLQLQNAGPSDSQISDTVVSTIANMVQPGDQIETEMEAVMVASPSSIVSSVNVVQSPVVSHTIQTSAQMAQQRMSIRRKRSSSRGGLQDIAEAAATLSQIPQGCPSPVRPTSPYQHHQPQQQQQQQQQQYVTTSRAHTSANMGFPDESLSLGQLPPTSEHQNMHHQQFIQSSQSMQVLQNPYPGLKLINNKPYPSNDGVPHSLPHHHQVVQHMNTHQLPPRGIAQQPEAGAINLQVVQPPHPYPVSLVTRDLHLQQQQNQHQQQQQQQQQQQHMHQSQLAQHAHPQHLQPQQHPQQQQQQQHHVAASATQPAQIQIILPSSGFSSPHHANQQVPQVSLPSQVSQSGRPQIVVQFQEPAVSAPAPQPNVITLSSSVCQALISQMRMQDSIAGQNTGYQPDSTSVTSQEVVVAVDAQGATSSHGVHLNKVVQ